MTAACFAMTNGLDQCYLSLLSVPAVEELVPPEVKRRKAMRKLQKYVAKHLVRAQSPEQVDEALDALLDDVSYVRMSDDVPNIDMKQALHRILFRSTNDAAKRFPMVASVIGQSKLEHCDKLILESLRGCFFILSQIASQRPDKNEVSKTPSFYNGPRLTSMPSVLRRAIYGGQIATVCMIGIVEAEENAKLRTIAIVNRLSDRLIEGVLSILRLLAELPGTDVSPDLVRPEERVPFDEMLRNDKAIQLSYAKTLDDAKRVNVYPYPPVSADD